VAAAKAMFASDLHMIFADRQSDTRFSDQSNRLNDETKMPHERLIV
jgi:hypothetical protein